MDTNSISSQLLSDAVQQFAKLPGIGKKTALRLVLHLLKQETETVQQLVKAIDDMKSKIQYCKVCHNISDEDTCIICANPLRDQQTICVVENIRDVISIESTGQFMGTYHVLGGLIAPLDGVGPDQLNIVDLVNRCQGGEVRELIMALNPTIEGDTTVYFISKSLSHLENIKITSIARGVAFGAEIEYTDEYTLGKALNKRLPIDSYVNVERK